MLRTGCGLTASLRESWGYETPAGMTLVPPPLAFSTRLPHTLEGGHEAAFYIEVAAMLQRVPAGTALKPFVTTPLGKIYGESIILASS